MSFLPSLSAPKNIFSPPPLLYLLRTQPIKTLIRLLDFAFSLFRSSSPPLSNPPIRIVCISDTHTLTTPYIPDGDILIHAGDLANAGTPAEIQAQIDWLDALPHAHKIVIAGNHDTYLDPRSRATLSKPDRNGTLDWKTLTYLQHASATLTFPSGRSLKVFGAPQIPACGGPEHAFQYPRGADAWSDTVPRDTDVLITHTPPKYHLDLPAALGCEHLLAEVRRVQPALHVFGHVHAGRSDLLGMLKGGREVVRWDERQARVERALGRPDGFFRGVLDPRGWVDVVKITFYGLAGAVWTRIWGGKTAGSTTMVLASLMYCDSGELGNAAQVVEL